MVKNLTTYDPAAALVDDAEIAAFMADAFETGDAGYIAHALGIVARAKGMTQIARDTGLSREQLYRSFSEAGNPTLKTTLAVMKALGIETAHRTGLSLRMRRRIESRVGRSARKACGAGWVLPSSVTLLGPVRLSGTENRHKATYGSMTR
jgi:probable addiction module antidote protein